MQGNMYLSKSIDSNTTLNLATPIKSFKAFAFSRQSLKKIEEPRQLSDRIEVLMDSLVVHCYEENFKSALNKLLQEFLDLNPQFKSCCYRILMNESTHDILCPIIHEVRDGKLSDELGAPNNNSNDESRLIKILTHFDSFKDIFNDP